MAYVVNMSVYCLSSTNSSIGNPKMVMCSLLCQRIFEKYVCSVKEYRLYRYGLEYRTMTTGKFVVHDSDKSRLPEGTVLIKTFSTYSYEQVSEIVKHWYNVFRYKMPDGGMYNGYCKISERILKAELTVFDYLGMTFMPGVARNRKTDKIFTAFSPAISKKSAMKIRELNLN